MERKTDRCNWAIRPLTEADVEPYLDIYLNSYPAYKSLDEECRAHYREKHLTELREDTQTRTMGLFEDGVLIATMKLILFSMNIFGVMQPACGLMALEVHPLHKRKGAALAMVRYFEDYARRSGALLTLLLPFRIGFYRQMGYGFAGKIYEYHLPTAALPRPDAAVLAHLRLMQPEDFDAALACHRRFAARNHGMVEKFDEEIRGARGDIQVRRLGWYDGGVLRGYAAYRFESASDSNYTQNRLSVEELVYEDGAILRGLLGGAEHAGGSGADRHPAHRRGGLPPPAGRPAGRVEELHRLRLFADERLRRWHHVQAGGRRGIRAPDGVPPLPGGDADGGVSLPGRVGGQRALSAHCLLRRALGGGGRGRGGGCDRHLPPG